MKKLYVPENFDIAEFLRSTKFNSKRYYDKFNYLIHLIYEQRILYHLDNTYIPLKSAYLRNIISCRYENYRDVLINHHVVDCDGHYVKGRKSYGYKLLQPYSGVRHREIQLTDKIILQNLEKWRQKRLPTTEIHQHLYNFLNQITIDYNSALELVNTFKVDEYNSSKIAIDKFLDRDFFIYKDNYDRVHTNITNLKSNLRQYLRYKDQKLVNVDIINSQPLILLLTKPIISSIRCALLNDFSDGLDIFNYKSLVEHGKLYDFMMFELSMADRKQFKEKFFREIFFGKRVSSYFWRLFPTIAKLLEEIKKSDYRTLAWMMQRAEADIIINRICRRIMSEYPYLFISTIHDSILTVESGIDVVKKIIWEEFGLLGLVPAIRIEE